MKILKARNGIALVAVLAIMLISSLFIPLMFNLSDTSLYVAVKNSERQRANYFARTITEMCVASFTKIDTKRTRDNPDEDEKLNNEEKVFVRTIINMSDPNSANYDPTGKIETQTIYMLSKMENGEEVIEYASDETVKNELIQKKQTVCCESKELRHKTFCLKFRNSNICIGVTEETLLYTKQKDENRIVCLLFLLDNFRH